jgi:hypothetical protein
MNAIVHGALTQAQEIAFLHAVIIVLLLTTAGAILAAVLLIAILRGDPQRLHERLQKRAAATWSIFR